MDLSIIEEKAETSGTKAETKAVFDASRQYTTRWGRRLLIASAIIAEAGELKWNIPCNRPRLSLMSAEQMVVGPSRDRISSRVRQVFMYLLYFDEHLTCPQVGRELGNRDHTTVLWGIRLVESQLTQDPRLVEFVARVRTRHQLLLHPSEPSLPLLGGESEPPPEPPVPIFADALFGQWSEAVKKTKKRPVKPDYSI